MEITFRTLGYEKTVDNIMKFQNIAERKLGFKMLEVVRTVVNDAKYLAPVDTGFLRNSIRGHVLRKQVWVIGKIISPAPYSIYQEFGSTHNSRHPYMIPAFKNNMELIERLLGDALRESMAKAEYKGSLIRKGL